MPNRLWENKPTRFVATWCDIRGNRSSWPNLLKPIGLMLRDIQRRFETPLVALSIHGTRSRPMEFNHYRIFCNGVSNDFTICISATNSNHHHPVPTNLPFSPHLLLTIKFDVPGWVIPPPWWNSMDLPSWRIPFSWHERIHGPLEKFAIHVPHVPFHNFLPLTCVSFPMIIMITWINPVSCF